MLPVYSYEPIKVIHFEFNLEQFEDYLSARDVIINVNQELIPRHQIFDIVATQRECRIEMRFTYRILNFNNEICFGSYISEQVFYLKYVDEEDTSKQIKHLFNNAHFMSDQEYGKLLLRHELPSQISLPSCTIPEYFISDLLKILKSNPLQNL